MKKDMDIARRPNSTAPLIDDLEQHLEGLKAQGSFVEALDFLCGLFKQCPQDQDASATPYEPTEEATRVLLRTRSQEAIARYELSVLLLCTGRAEEADVHIAALGYRWRLGDSIFYPQGVVKRDEASAIDVTNTNPNPATDTCKAPLVVDNVLPDALLAQLRYVFAPDGHFFREHGYHDPDRERRFFSYHRPLPSGDVPDSDIIATTARHLRPLLAASFPDRSQEILDSDLSAEWWAHARQSGEGHQLHFDMDESLLSRFRGKGMSDETRARLHPLVSCVLYLHVSGSHLGRTLVLNQTLEQDSYASKGYLVEARSNRLLAFGGEYLHGVVPTVNDNGDNSDNDDDDGGWRVTLMLGFWPAGVTTNPTPTWSRATGLVDINSLGPNMTMPLATAGTRTAARKRRRGASGTSPDWMSDIEICATVQPTTNPTPGGAAAPGTQEDVGIVPGRLTNICPAIPVEPVWVPVGSTSHDTHDASTGEPDGSDAESDEAEQCRNVGAGYRGTSGVESREGRNQDGEALGFMSLEDLQALRRSSGESNGMDAGDEDEEEEEKEKMDEEEDEEEDEDEVVFPSRYFLYSLDDIYREIVDE